MRISVHLRGGINLTDSRVKAIGKGLEALGNVTVTYSGRGNAPDETDLVIQTGFNKTLALQYALEHRLPYIVMETPSFKQEYDGWNASTYTYNGMQQGGTRAEAPTEPRLKPELQPMKTEGNTIIFAQRPNDHSLRGSNHMAWLQEQLDAYPEAIFRHHPIMVPKGYNQPIAAALAECQRAVAYTSTASVEALVDGCEVICGHPGNEAYGVTDREAWLHQLSWQNFSHKELETSAIASYILEGYEEAVANAKAGKQEIPREKLVITSQTLQAEYYAKFPY